MGVAQMSKVVIIGAGKTGRGFLARLLKDQKIVFIDKKHELVEALNKEKKKIRLLALLDTLEYLKKGGRISSAVAFAGNLNFF